jgi:DNA recombination protein RmuC
MTYEFSILLSVVGAAILIMLGVNLYLMLRPKKKEGEEQYVVLHQRFDALSQLVSSQLREGRESTERATLSVHQQVQSFTQGMVQLQETVRQVQDSVKDVSSFQDIFKSPKLRGIWGEASLEAALGQYFSRDLYEMQHYFKSGEAVDAILKLPNGLILPVDSKFNWENFEKMVHAETDMNKEIYRKQFFSDVKKKIDEIATKYILPSEGTTDTALMYVPAETVYYEIINNIQEVDVPAYARAKKVYLVSPNTFALSVSTIMHWFRDVEVTKRTRDIIKRLERIAADGGKLGDDFRKLGSHLTNARGAFDESEKRLGLMVGRVQNVIKSGEDEAKELEGPIA